MATIPDNHRREKAACRWWDKGAAPRAVPPGRGIRRHLCRQGLFGGKDHPQPGDSLLFQLPAQDPGQGTATPGGVCDVPTVSLEGSRRLPVPRQAMRGIPLLPAGFGQVELGSDRVDGVHHIIGLKIKEEIAVVRQVKLVSGEDLRLWVDGGKPLLSN